MRLRLDEELLGENRSTAEMLATTRAVKDALVTPAGCPHTPDGALVAALPLTPAGFAQELAKLRPAVTEACTEENLGRGGDWRDPVRTEPLVEVAGDAELVASGDPAAALTGYLAHLPQGDQVQRPGSR
jgi:hypothetical protein